MIDVSKFLMKKTSSSKFNDMTLNAVLGFVVPLCARDKDRGRIVKTEKIEANKMSMCYLNLSDFMDIFVVCIS